MVDTTTLNRLSSEDKNEFQRYSKSFIKAVRKSGALDGLEFSQKYSVRSDGESFYLSDASAPFAGIRSKSRAVIEALLVDAIQNHGR